MRCYVCEKAVTSEEHEQIQKELTKMDDDLEEDRIMQYVDRLGLVHCTGPDDMFDSEGGVVVCRTCHEYGLS